MNRRKLLFIGFGDLASRAASRFLAEGCDVTGVARGPREVQKGVTFWRGAATDPTLLQQIASQPFDAVVITLTPDGRREADYERSYVATSERLIHFWQKQPVKPGLILYASSTRVYQQNRGEWVDEETPVRPDTPQGQHLLKAERLWRESGLATSILRFAGIYGPGRDHLIRQVQAGNGGPKAGSPYTNRIHAEDCAGVIHYLVHRHWANQPLEPLYLASDGHPATSWEVRSWLAHQLGYGSDHLQETPSARTPSKRCSNARLIATGYEFLYPDYRSGYSDLLRKAAASAP